MRTSKFVQILGLAVLLVALPAGLVAQEAPQLDFSRYVALGDSLTAGFASGGLAEGNQVTSYPALIFQQTDGSRVFEQPIVSEPGLPPQLQLVGLSPITLVPKPGLGEPQNLFLPRPYDNLGVPGADVNDLVNTVSDDGGAHDLILRGIGTALEQAIGLQPTFVTLFIGSNDVLGAATSGIVIDGVTLTTFESFSANYTTVVGALAQFTGAPMAIATVPGVTSIPFVTTIPPFVVDPVTNEPILIGGNVVPLIGPNGPLTMNDNVLLTASGLLAQGIGIPAALGGTGQPLPNHAVLDAAETALVNERTEEFNSFIRAAASQVGAALVDVNEVFAEVAEDGLSVGGVEFTTDFITGGLFSFDGVHANAMGYGVLANEFIKAINRHFGSDFSQTPLAPLGFSGDGAVPLNVTAQQAAQSIYTPRAYDQLRRQLGTPSYARLYRILRNRGDGGDGDDGGASGGGGSGDSDRPGRPGHPPVH